jgi:hypothetical protein
MNQTAPAAAAGRCFGRLPRRLRKEHGIANSSAAEAGGATRPRRFWAHLAAGLVATAAAAVILPMTAASASASYPTGSPGTPGCWAGSNGSGITWDFSPYFPTTNCQVDDCHVTIGAVKYPYNPYYILGGVRIDCATRHAVVAATVWQEYWNGSSWVRYQSSRGTWTNQYGSGGILYTPMTCAPPGAPVGGWLWHTYALVQTERTGAWLYSAGHLGSGSC